MERRSERGSGLLLMLMAFIAAAVVWLAWSAAGERKNDSTGQDAVLVYEEARIWTEDV